MRENSLLSFQTFDADRILRFSSPLPLIFLPLLQLQVINFQYGRGKWLRKVDFHCGRPSEGKTVKGHFPSLPFPLP